MRYVLKSITLIGLICVCVFAATVLWESNDLQRFLPQQTQEQDPAETNDNTSDGDAATSDGRETTQVTFQAPSLYVNGQLTNATNDLAYIHENGFEVGKEALRDQSVTPAVEYDDQGRLSAYTVRITPDTVLVYSVEPSDGAAFVAHQFAKDAPLVPVTDDAWRYAMHPYLNAVGDYVRKSGQGVVMRIELDYDGNDDDQAPRYIDLKAFSAEDLGTTCSVWVTFANRDPERPVDYEALAYFGEADSTDAEEGGGADG